MGVFVNFSNHPSSGWPEDQTREAEKYGRIVDVPFPQVTPDATSEEVRKHAKELADEIIGMDPEAVMAMGEFTLTYSVIYLLKEKGIKVVSACTKREKQETVHEDGSVENVAVFRFMGFREY